MTLQDFTKQPRGPLKFDIWRAKQAIPSPMGDFAVELHMAMGDSSPPSEDMLRQADTLVALFKAHVTTIHAKIFEHYQAVADQGEWLAACGVSEGLDREGIVEHLQDRRLVVSRDEDDDQSYLSRVFLTPDWDEEHAIYLAHEDGEWVFVEC